MKKLLNRIASVAAAVAVVASASFVVFAGTAHAIPYDPNSTGLNHPGFNVFTGVPDVGNEAQFLRGRVSGSSNAFTNPVNDACADNTQYSLQIYVHNGANQSLNDNGNGVGVAHGTKVKVGVPALTSSAITAAISANNAATINDSMNINCNGKTMQLSYVAGSAVEQEQADGTVLPLSDSIVTTGALIGSHATNGDMWGCWEQRVIVYLKVQVKEVPTPPVPSTGSCKAVGITTDNNSRKVTATVTGQVSNAQIVGYQIDFGDGTVVNQQTASHTYAKDGTYTIVTRAQVKFADGHTEWLTATACTKQVTFKNNVPVTPVTPVTPPATVLPNTGAGDIIGIFAATTVAGAFVHSFRRRLFNRG